MTEGLDDGLYRIPVVVATRWRLFVCSKKKHTCAQLEYSILFSRITLILFATHCVKITRVSAQRVEILIGYVFARLYQNDFVVGILLLFAD